MAIIHIELYSVAAKPIEMQFQGQSLSSGTAFIWQVNQQAYLITNWHNITGINPQTKQHLSPMVAEPDSIVVYLDKAGKLGERFPTTLDLRDGNGNPLWLEHPKGHIVDVVALPLAIIPEVDFHPINALTQFPMRVSVGLDAFILGYPFGIGVSTLPIWKRASIASEPEISINNLPYFYVDTASRPGMSGSPVILYSDSGSFIDEKGNRGISTAMTTRFIGIYSGRIGAEDELKAQLGTVWRAEVIEQIISGARPGQIP